MKNIFEQKISVYSSVYDNTGYTMPLLDFLLDESIKDTVEAIRMIDDKKERDKKKSMLRMGTISGVFAPTRKVENIVSYTSLMCLDIDGKDHPQISDWEIVKQQLCKIPQIAFASLSVSGRGLFLIIPIAYPELHKLHFKALEKDFKRMGLTIDNKCSDICRLRGQSYDANYYINPNAAVYQKIIREERTAHQPYNRIQTDDDTMNKVSSLCAAIDRLNINMCEDYADWFAVGASLASLGESGRTPYHICSRQSSKYIKTECDKKFNNLMQTISKFTIGTFFEICKRYHVQPELSFKPIHNDEVSKPSTVHNQYKKPYDAELMMIILLP